MEPFQKDVGYFEIFNVGIIGGLCRTKLEHPRYVVSPTKLCLLLLDIALSVTQSSYQMTKSRRFDAVKSNLFWE